MGMFRSGVKRKFLRFLVFEQLEAGFLQHTEMSEYGREKHVVAAKF
jgi:hypothetical protein